MAIDSTQLRTKIREAARKAFEQLRRERAGEAFYGYALYTDEGLMTIMPTANSEEGHARTVKKYESFDADERPDSNHMRWYINEWAYEGAGSDHFQEVYDLLNSDQRDGRDIDDDSEADEAFRQLGNKVIGGMVAALRELDEEGFFGQGAAREKVTLVVTVSDSDASYDIENKSAGQLNPPSVAAAFAKRFEE